MYRCILPICGVVPPTDIQEGGTALLCAAEQGHLEVVRTLLAAGANPMASTTVRGSRERRIVCLLR